MHFSGNSLSPAFDLTLNELFGFVYEIGTAGIGDDPAFDPTLNQNLIEGIGAIGPVRFYTSGLGPNGFIGGVVGGQLTNPGGPTENALDSSPNLVLVNLVPEPAATGACCCQPPSQSPPFDDAIALDDKGDAPRLNARSSAEQYRESNPQHHRPRRLRR